MDKIVNLGIDQLERSQLIRRGRPQPIPTALRHDFSVTLAPPVIVRTLTPHRYEILFNEWVWLLAQHQGVMQVPAWVRDDLNDEEAAILIAMTDHDGQQSFADIEQLHKRLLSMPRKTGNPRSKKGSLYGSHTKLAFLANKNRSTLSHDMRLLRLAPPVRALLEQGKLKKSYARVLVSLAHEDQYELAQQAITQKLNARKIAQLARERRGGGKSRVRRLTKPPRIDRADSVPVKDSNTERLERELSDLVGSEVRLDSQSGQLVVDYKGDNDILLGIIRRWGFHEEY